jgi:nitrite reductase/ring-hydroxylating ferredoxin subunit
MSDAGCARRGVDSFYIREAWPGIRHVVGALRHSENCRAMCARCQHAYISIIESLIEQHMAISERRCSAVVVTY